MVPGLAARGPGCRLQTHHQTIPRGSARTVIYLAARVRGEFRQALAPPASRRLQAGGGGEGDVPAKCPGVSPPRGAGGRPTDLGFGPARAQPPSGQKARRGPQEPRESGGGAYCVSPSRAARPLLRERRGARGAVDPAQAGAPRIPFRGPGCPAGVRHGPAPAARSGFATGAGAASTEGARPRSAPPPFPCPEARDPGVLGARAGGPRVRGRRGGQSPRQGRAHAQWD